MKNSQYLRETAALMREIASCAPTAPWVADFRADGRAWINVAEEEPAPRLGHIAPPNANRAWSMHGFSAAALHVASWDPTVALAVADLLENVGCNCSECACCGIRMCSGECEPALSAMKLARVYRGVA